MKKFFTIISLLSVATLFSQSIGIETFATGFNNPVAIANAGNGNLFIVERRGVIQIVDENGDRNDTPFLNIDPLVASGGEYGLLGLAFHPNYAENGYFYVNYSNNQGNNVISRFTRSTTDDEIADPDSELHLLTIEQPYSNHNGGDIAFGPDGYLYIASGDGGSGGDPGDRAQSLTTPLGKMLRIDVDNTDNGMNYAIPETNPFYGSTQVLPEIWAYGLRNPWRFSFDRATGDLWIADVGQNVNEEINMVASTAAGVNYGWRCYEGNSPYDQTGNCPDQETMTFPIAQYTHNNSGLYKCSITGGFRYRGSLQSSLVGLYFFADYCSNEIGYLQETDSGWDMNFTSAFNGNNWTTFGEDANGELFIAGVGSGTVYRIIDTTLGVDGRTAFNVSIHPNPAENIIHLTTSSTMSKIESISIFDLQGQMVIELTDTSGINNINVAQLSSGMYFLNAVNAEGVLAMKKFVIN